MFNNEYYEECVLKWNLNTVCSRFVPSHPDNTSEGSLRWFSNETLILKARDEVFGQAMLFKKKYN